MVGNLKICQKCGARLKSDYQFCNICGHIVRSTEVRRGTGTTLKRIAPRIQSNVHHRGPKRPEIPTEPLPRRTAISVLLSLMAVAPLTPWLSVFDGALTVQAGIDETMYGCYLTLLAICGAPVLLWERLVQSLKMRRTVLAGLGIGAFGIILHDYLEALKQQAETYPSLTVVEPGTGMYLAFAVSLSLIVVALLPSSSASGSIRPRVTYAIRSGSPGSGPGAPR